MLDMYPPEKRAMLWRSGAWRDVGPIWVHLGGVLTDAYNWRWIFYQCAIRRGGLRPLVVFFKDTARDST